MLNPFQCVLFCSRLKQGLPSIVLAASGSSIYSIGSSDGALLSIWPKRTHLEKSVPADSDEVISERPEKRRKLSVAASSESSSAEIVVENGGKKKRSRARARLMGADFPAIIKLISTSSGKHAVAVTGEDKCIRVFDILDDGSIEQISERAMPKRPCSITLTTDEKSILCADKFGDVYALPFENVPIETHQTPDACQLMETDAPPVEKKFIPAANNLTIHTKTNQRALLNQQNTTNQMKVRKVITFAHELLLGHVSLLTDLVYVTVPNRSSNGIKACDYIVTADRDEHIRVSRGLSQSHVIENYCLGHTSFVSRLCVPKWNTTLLISGGGDNYLLLWDWLAGRIIQKVEITPLLYAHRPPQSTTSSTISDGKISLPESSSANIAISGLWAIQYPSKDEYPTQGELIVACEGVPMLLVFSITSNDQLDFRNCLHFPGNVLDLTHNPEQGVLFVTLDNAHRPWSTDQVREQRGNEFLTMCIYSTEEGEWTVATGKIGTGMAFNEWASKAELLESERPSQQQPLSDALYGIENLRKRGNEE